MKVGDKHEDGGRVLVIDAILPDGRYLNHVIGKVGEVQIEEPKPSSEPTAEPEEPGQETAEAQPEIQSEDKPDDLKCQYCGQMCKSKAGKGSHERNCKENPANK